MLGPLVALGILGCGEAAPDGGEPASEAVAIPVLLTEVRLPLPSMDGRFSREPELRGLLTLAVELGLADIPGVVPLVQGDGVPLAFAGTRLPPARLADARLRVRGSDDALELELEVCIAGEGCASTVAAGTSKAPWDAVGMVLEGAALALGGSVEASVAAAWRKPGSKDPYSELLTGRAAAAYFGLIPPSLTPGDRKLDPVVKAVYLDPGQPLAQWLRARWEVASTTDGGVAPDCLAKAQMLRPTSALLAADQAALLTLTGKTNEALMAWEALANESSGDPRWRVPLARARLAAGRAEEAVAVLEALPPEFLWDSAVAGLRVSAVEAVDGEADLDPLLARWQSVAVTNPEPVRRRISSRVRAKRFDDALEFLGPMRERAPGPGTDSLEVALLVALERFDPAADLAPPEVASRIRARRELSLNPAEFPASLPADDPAAAHVTAEVALARNDPAGALAAIDLALAVAPLDASSHVVRARALEALGRGHLAAESWARAWEIDPGLSGGPVEAARIASTFTFVEAGEHPEGLGELVAPGPLGPEL